VDSREPTIWIADAHRGDGHRFIVRADEKLTAFLELEAAIRAVTLFGTAQHSIALRSHAARCLLIFASPVFFVFIRSGGGESAVGLTTTLEP
jgi:hypothetical protein